MNIITAIVITIYLISIIWSLKLQIIVLQHSKKQGKKINFIDCCSVVFLSFFPIVNILVGFFARYLIENH